MMSKLLLAIAATFLVTASPFAVINVVNETLGESQATGSQDKRGCACGDNAKAASPTLIAAAVKGTTKVPLSPPPPDPPIPDCPDCVTLPITPAQEKCVDKWGTCPTNEHFIERRNRWKWKCATVTYISCGSWYDTEDCCGSPNGEPSCAGGSGLLPCSGTPAGTE